MHRSLVCQSSVVGVHLLWHQKIVMCSDKNAVAYPRTDRVLWELLRPVGVTVPRVVIHTDAPLIRTSHDHIPVIVDHIASVGSPGNIDQLILLSSSNVIRQ